MSRTCEKDFSITITTPIAYYTMDSWDGIAIRDSVASQDLDNFTIAAPTVIAGKINNGYELGDVSGTAPTYFGAYPMFNFSGSDWTIRFWFRRTTVAASVTIGFLQLQNSDGSAQRFSIEENDPGSFVDFGLRINGTLVLNTAFNLASNTWHHIVIWYRNGVQLGIRANDSVQATLASPSALNGASTDSLLLRGASLNFGNTSIKLDELVLIRNKYWDSSDITYDYNSGNGRTWPDLPS